MGKLDVAVTTAAPTRDRRGPGTIHRFRFCVSALWDYLQPADRVRVLAGHQALPIAGHGMSYRCDTKGSKDLAELAEKIAAGFVFSKFGYLQVPKGEDLQWQAAAFAAYEEVFAILRDEYPVEPFVCYGALLGAVRDGDFIATDTDIDLHYLSRHTEPLEVAKEFESLCYALIERGYRVNCGRSHAVVRSRENERHRVDISPNYFDADGLLQFPFGIAGRHLFRKEHWTGTTQVPIGAGYITAPKNAELLLECIYGPNWRVPDPGFSWAEGRRGRVWDAMVSHDNCERIYWASAHAADPGPGPSPFCLEMLQRDDLPTAVVDLGCGTGRDSVAFARTGRRVWAVDRCPWGLDRTRRAAADAGVQTHLETQACDFRDADAVARLFCAIRRDHPGPVLYYARFLLHAVTERTQEIVLARLGADARPGDLVALEFRSAPDEKLPKANSVNFRRFPVGDRVRTDLTERFGFETLMAAEGQGLAPYAAPLPPHNIEDPVVYRLLTRRGDGTG